VVTADDCFQLGKVAYNNEDFYHAIMWFDQALQLDDVENYKTTSRAALLDYFSFSLYMVSVVCFSIASFSIVTGRQKSFSGRIICGTGRQSHSKPTTTIITCVCFQGQQIALSRSLTESEMERCRLVYI